MRWIDTHCHLDAREFDPDRDAQRALARQRGVALCVLPAVEAAHFETVRDLAHRHGDVYALGIHPLYTPQARMEDLDTLAACLAAQRADKRLVAVGEIGLDHFVPGLDRGRQLFFYREQLRLARRHGLPVILHVRRSADDLLRELRRQPVAGGIAHAAPVAAGDYDFDRHAGRCRIDLARLRTRRVIHHGRTRADGPEVAGRCCRTSRSGQCDQCKCDSRRAHDVYCTCCGAPCASACLRWW